MSSPSRRPRLASLLGFVLQAAARLLADPSAPDELDDTTPPEPVSVDEQLLRALRPNQRREFH